MRKRRLLLMSTTILLMACVQVTVLEEGREVVYSLDFPRRTATPETLPVPTGSPLPTPTPTAAPMVYDEPAYPVWLVERATGAEYAPWDMTRTDVLETFETPNWIFLSDQRYDVDDQSVDGYHGYDGISFLIVGDEVLEMTILSPIYQLSNGLTVGCTLAEVESLMGSPEEINQVGSTTFYIYEFTSALVDYDLTFEAFQDGVVVEIGLYSDSEDWEDLLTPAPCLPDVTFVQDVAIFDDAEFAPGEAFQKIWRVRSSGCAAWPSGSRWVLVSGDRMMGKPVSVPDTLLGDTIDIAVSMVAPDVPGTYRSDWQMQAPDGTLFGERCYVTIVVVEPVRAPVDEPEPTPAGPLPTPLPPMLPTPMPPEP